MNILSPLQSTLQCFAMGTSPSGDEMCLRQAAE